MYVTSLKRDLFQNYTKFFNMLFIKNFTKLRHLFTFFVNIIEGTILTVGSVMKNNKTTSSFFREGFFLDCLQKLSTDKALKNVNIKTIQLFDLSNYKVVRFLIDDVYRTFSNVFSKGDDVSVFNIMFNLLFTFLLVFQFLFIFFILIYFLF